MALHDIVYPFSFVRFGGPALHTETMPLSPKKLATILLSLRRPQRAQPLLVSGDKATNIDASVLLSVRAPSMFATHNNVTVVSGAIGPTKIDATMQLAALPLPGHGLAVGPSVSTAAMPVI